MADLLFSEYVKENKVEFLAKVEEVSKRLGINPDWLMAVMKKESTLRSTAVNSLTGASGLIQFMPKTAVGLGTSCAALRKMTNVYQLNFVEKYFLPYRGRIKSFPDLYIVTFFPVALGKADDWVMRTGSLAAGTIAAQNPGVNINKDGEITVGEFKEYCFKGFTAIQTNILKKKVGGV